MLKSCLKSKRLLTVFVMVFAIVFGIIIFQPFRPSLRWQIETYRLDMENVVNGFKDCAVQALENTETMSEAEQWAKLGKRLREARIILESYHLRDPAIDFSVARYSGRIFRLDSKRSGTSIHALWAGARKAGAEKVLLSGPGSWGDVCRSLLPSEYWLEGQDREVIDTTTRLSTDTLQLDNLNDFPFALSYFPETKTPEELTAVMKQIAQTLVKRANIEGQLPLNLEDKTELPRPPKGWLLAYLTKTPAERLEDWEGRLIASPDQGIPLPLEIHKKRPIYSIVLINKKGAYYSITKNLDVTL